MQTMDFDSVLLDVLRSRGQERFKIKPKQKEALKKIVLDGQDCLIVLPTGYGKSLIYQLLPSLFDRVSKDSSKDKSVVIVVSPLNALIEDRCTSRVVSWTVAFFPFTRPHYLIL